MMPLEVVLRLLSSLACVGVATVAAANNAPHPGSAAVVGATVGTLGLVESVARDVADLQARRGRADYANDDANAPRARDRAQSYRAYYDRTPCRQPASQPASRLG